MKTLARRLPVVAAFTLTAGLGACSDDPGLFAPSPPIQMPDFAKGGNGGGGGNGGNTGGGTTGATPARILYSFFDDVSMVWSVNPDGTDRRVIPNTEEAAHPAWSPDRRKIAFTTGYGAPTKGLWVIKANGSARRLVLATEVAHQPSWSPDGRRIAFASADANNNVAIFVINEDGTGLRQVTTPAGGWSHWAPSWSMDGQRIAYQLYQGLLGEIAVINADGSSPVTLTNCALIQVMCSSPEWRPGAGSQRIAYSMRSEAGMALGFINADGSDYRSILFRADHQAWDFRPSWSPDGTRLVFGSRMGGLPNAELFTVAMDGTDLRRITDTPDIAESTPAWAR